MSRLADLLFQYLGRLRRRPDLAETTPAHLGNRTPTSLAVERDVLVVAEPHPGKSYPLEPASEQPAGERPCWLRRILASIEGPSPWSEEWPRLRSLPACRAVLRGDRRAGKTFLLHMLARRLADNQRAGSPGQANQPGPVPILVELPELIVPGEAGLTEEQVRQGLLHSLQRQEAPARLRRFLAGNAHQRWIWLLIDTPGNPGDEMDLGRVLQAIRGWDCRVLAALPAAGAAPLAVASEDSARQLLAADNWRLIHSEFWLAPLNPVQAGQFLRLWFAALPVSERSCLGILERLLGPEGRPFLASPFWLGGLCAVLEQPGVIPRLLEDRIRLADLFGPLPSSKWREESRPPAPNLYPSGQLPTWHGVRSLLAGQLDQSSEEALLWQLLEPGLTEQLVQLAGDPNERVRRSVVRILRRMHRFCLDAPEAAGLLQRMTEDEDPRICQEALLGLLQQGPHLLTPAIVNQLRCLLKAYSGGQRVLLLDGILRENRRTAERLMTRLLPELLTDGEVQVRLRAGNFLARQVADEDQWARHLPGLLRDQSLEMCRLGLGLLKRYRAAYLDERLLGALLDLLSHRDHQGVWDEALDLLRQRILPRQRQSVRWLLASMFADSGNRAEGVRFDPNQRLALLEACRSLGADLFEDEPTRCNATSAYDLLEQLCALLKEPGEARRLAARLLLDFAHAGKEERLLRRLGEYAGDPDESVRELALTALERLQERDNQ